MALNLPWTFSKDDPAGPDLENRLQDVFDQLALQFPISAQNPGAFQFGTLAAVTADGGGWCNFTLPASFANQIDAVIAMNNWAGVDPDGFRNVQANPANDPQHFRAFVGVAGKNCSCVYIATGH